MPYSGLRSNDNSIPVPVSVTLYNLLPSHRNDAAVSVVAPPRWYRPEHSSELLVPVRLDIYKTRARKEKGDESNANKREQQDELVMYSSLNEHAAVHPTWHHLDERLELEPLETAPLVRITALPAAASSDCGDDAPRVLVDNLPLDPKLLRRLPEEQGASDQVLAWELRPPPKALPPNAVLVQYSDGSIRVDPVLYYLLLDRKIIVEANKRDASLIQDDEEENRRATRFNDKAFDVLDQVNMSSPKRTSLLETDNEALATPVGAAQDLGFPELHDTNGEHAGAIMNGHHEPSVTEEANACIEDLLQEKAALEAMIESESAMLEEEICQLLEEKADLNSVADHVSHIDDEIEAIRNLTQQLRNEHKVLDLRVEAQRVKLLKELRTIYPIQCRPEEHQYCIRGLELPVDLYSDDVSEDELSAALGFVCHSLVMMSKYLSIPLRYRIICNSSRSAVQDDTVDILPLFQARVVEPSQLDRGMALLHKNIDCILKNRGVPCGETSHILAKMKIIYDEVVGDL